jgi:cell division septation protein DedD
MVTHNPALTTYATRVIHMLDGEIDTDIKTVDDRDLPHPGDPERISVRILPKKDNQIEIAVDAKTNVVVTGNNVIAAKESTSSDKTAKSDKKAKKDKKSDDKPKKTSIKVKDDEEKK